MPRLALSLSLAALMLLASVGFSEQGRGAMFTVDSTADVIDTNLGDGLCATLAGECTLRAAVMENNQLGGGATVIVPAGTFALALTGAGTSDAHGDLDVNAALVIQGAGIGSTIVDATLGLGVERAFHATADLDLSQLTVQPAGFVFPGPNILGGAVWSRSGVDLTLSEVEILGFTTGSAPATMLDHRGDQLVLNDVIFVHRRSPIAVVPETGSLPDVDINGLVISEEGSPSQSAMQFNTGEAMALDIDLANLHFEGNSALSLGPNNAANLDVAVSLSIVDSVFLHTGTAVQVDNSFPGYTAMFDVDVVIEGSAFVEEGGFGVGLRLNSQNMPDLTGTIRSSSFDQSGVVVGSATSVVVENSSFQHGGLAAIQLSGDAEVSANNVTIDGASRDFGSGSLTLRNSIVTGVCEATTFIGGNNVLASAGSECEGTADVIGDPSLGPLQDNGGSTLTMAIDDTSVAVEAGSSLAPGSGGAACLATDQRGTGRPTDGDNSGTATCDAGAYEIGAPPGLDLGDAPDHYITLFSSGGPSHVVGSLFLGAQVDVDSDGQPSMGFDGDDLQGVDDEDGVAFSGPVFVGQMATVEVTSSEAGLFSLWVEGAFSPDSRLYEPFLGAASVDSASLGDSSLRGTPFFGGQVIVDAAVGAGANTLMFLIPPGTTSRLAGVRARLSTESGLSFDGPAMDGEVEDFQVVIAEEVDLGVTATADPPAAMIGETVVFTVVVTNAGPSLAGSAEVSVVPGPGAANAVVDLWCHQWWRVRYGVRLWTHR